MTGHRLRTGLLGARGGTACRTGTGEGAGGLKAPAWQGATRALVGHGQPRTERSPRTEGGPRSNAVHAGCIAGRVHRGSGHWFVWCVMALAGACAAPEDGASVSPLRENGRAMREGGPRQPIVLPDLSGVAVSVQRQVREHHARLTAKLAEPQTPPVELGNAFGELGLVLMAAEYHDAAAACFSSAIDLAPDAMRWPYYLGHLHAVDGDRAAAAELYARAHELRPSDLPAAVRLGETLLDQSRPDAAEQAFMRALQLDSGSAAALAGVGRAALARGDAARAVDYLRRALTADEGATSLHYPLAMAYRQLGDLDEARAHLGRRGSGVAAVPDPLLDAYSGVLESAITYETRGLRALQSGQVAAAEDLFRRGLELAPDDPALRHRLGTVLMMAGDPGGAVEQFEETIRRSPDFAKAHFGLAMVAMFDGRYPEAVERFSEAVGRQPDYLEARIGLADGLRVTGRAEASLEHYRQVVVADPRFADAWMGYVLALAGLGRLDEARDRLGEAQAILPGHPRLAQLRAQLP